MPPRLTVAVPAYNRPAWTARAVRSALAVPVDGLEVVVVDDHSPEDVVGPLRAIPDARLRVVRNPANVGLFANFNRCLAEAGGASVCVLCCDDVADPDGLARAAAVLDRHPAVDLVTTRGRFVGLDGTPLGPLADLLPPGVYPAGAGAAAALWFFTRYSLNPFNFPSGVVLRRAAAVRAGGFDTALRVAGDVKLFVRMATAGGLAVAPWVGCDVTRHPGQVSAASEPSAVALRELADLTADRHGLRPYWAGHAVGQAILQLTARRPAAAAAYARLAADLGPLPPAVLALAETAGRRAAALGCGYPPGPVRPRPLDGP